MCRQTPFRYNRNPSSYHDLPYTAAFAAFPCLVRLASEGWVSRFTSICWSGFPVGLVFFSAGWLLSAQRIAAVPIFVFMFSHVAFCELKN
jgi:hypothetical protein